MVYPLSCPVCSTSTIKKTNSSTVLLVTCQGLLVKLGHISLADIWDMVAFTKNFINILLNVLNNICQNPSFLDKCYIFLI